MNVLISAAVVASAGLVVAGCSRPGGGTTRDTGVVNADSVTAVNTGRRGGTPSGEPSAPSSATPARAPDALKPPATGPADSMRSGGGRPRLASLSPSSGSIVDGAVLVVQLTATRLTATGN